MKRLILASLAVATLALAMPSQAPAAGPIRRAIGRLFGRPPVSRQLNIQVGGGRGFAVQRSVVRVAPPVVVQQPVIVQQRFIRQRSFSVRRRGF